MLTINEAYELHSVIGIVYGMRRRALPHLQVLILYLLVPIALLDFFHRSLRQLSVHIYTTIMGLMISSIAHHLPLSFPRQSYRLSESVSLVSLETGQISDHRLELISSILFEKILPSSHVIVLIIPMQITSYLLEIRRLAMLISQVISAL